MKTKSMFLRRKERRKMTLSLSRSPGRSSTSQVVAALDRTKCSGNTGVAVAAAILKGGGADLSQFSVSKTTVSMTRSENREVTAD